MTWYNREKKSGRATYSSDILKKWVNSGLVGHVSLFVDYSFWISIYICILIFLKIFLKNLVLTMVVWALKLGDWATTIRASGLQASPPLGKVLPPPGQAITQLGPEEPRPR